MNREVYKRCSSIIVGFSRLCAGAEAEFSSFGIANITQARLYKKARERMNLSLQFCSLSSSSEHGNSYLIRAEGTYLLIDYGVRLRRMEKFLDQLGVKPGSIEAIFITHEHRDHTQAMHIKYPLHTRYNIRRIVTSPRTLNKLGCKNEPPFCPLPPGREVNVSGISVRGLSKPHDAAQPLAFHLSTETASLAVVTDLGCMTPGLLSSLKGCNYYIFESNHDMKMEMNSGRPPTLIDRVLGDRGHLSNHQAARALGQMVTEQTHEIMLAHLSLECNRPELAARVVKSHLAQRSCWQGRVAVAPPDHVSPWRGLTENRQHSAGV